MEILLNEINVLCHIYCINYFQFLMEAVSVYLQSHSQPPMTNLDQKVITTSSTQELCMNVTEFQDFVFLLGRLWKLDLDEIKNYWTVTLFADGAANQGKSVSAI